MSENNFASHTFIKDGIYYFNRRIPTELRKHYTTPKISYSLRTKSRTVAVSRAQRAATQLDEYWYHLRSADADLPGKHLLRSGSGNVWPPESGDSHVNSTAPTLSEAVEMYLRLKGSGKSKTFHQAAQRNCGYVIDTCGDKPIDCYTKSDANSFRDDLINRDMAGSSMTRIFGTVRSVFNFCTSEAGLDIKNPFGNVYFDRFQGVSKRATVDLEVIRTVQELCFRKDDDIRWLVALVADTGMRLAEAAGLSCEDFQRDEAGGLTVRIRPHPWRRLKTSGSERTIPLVGSAHWAANRILEVHGGGHAFPRYNKTDVTNANGASASVNKWLREYVPEGITMHSFRHAMRDRLRAIECPSDVVDQIGGWQTEGVGHSYGKGYPIAVLLKWMERTA